MQSPSRPGDRSQPGLFYDRVLKKLPCVPELTKVYRKAMTTSFSEIRRAALARHTEADIGARLPEPKDTTALRAGSDDRYLSLMTLRVFSAGLKHSLVQSKWPAFEDIFHGFQPARVAFMNEDDLDRLMKDTRLIRHVGKLRATLHNGAEMTRIAGACGSFGNYLADWPGEDVVGLWEDLGKRFKQLGGNSAPYFLRMAGKDTWTMSNDVIKALAQWEGLEDPKKNRSNRRGRSPHGLRPRKPGR